MTLFPGGSDVTKEQPAIARRITRNALSVPHIKHLLDRFMSTTRRTLALLLLRRCQKVQALALPPFCLRAIRSLPARAWMSCPRTSRPIPEVPEHFVAQEVLAALAADRDTSPAVARWWEGFEDPLLNDMVERALEQNLRISAAVARLRNARSAVDFEAAGDSPCLPPARSPTTSTSANWTAARTATRTACSAYWASPGSPTCSGARSGACSRPAPRSRPPWSGCAPTSRGSRSRWPTQATAWPP